MVNNADVSEVFQITSHKNKFEIRISKSETSTTRSGEAKFEILKTKYNRFVLCISNLFRISIFVFRISRVLIIHEYRCAEKRPRCFFKQVAAIVCGEFYQAKWAKALLASAMRWTFSRLVIAAPSRL